MLASLPMYDHPAIRGATDRYWQAIRSHLGIGPETLTRDGSLWDHWLSPDLLLSQTCGYPYRAHLHGHVTLVGAPDHRLPGCAPGFYNSIFVARRDDPRLGLLSFEGAVFAFNEAASQSGWAAPMLHVRGLGLRFGAVRRTGAHRLSAHSVATGEADLAALDALSWALIQRHESFSQDLKPIAHTTPTPALPYITARHRAPRPLFDAITAAIADLPERDRVALNLHGLVPVDATSYMALPSPPPPPGP